ncbi:hypothetical protein C0995_004379, partial [Termitomyces sp. Mi166
SIAITSLPGTTQAYWTAAKEFGQSSPVWGNGTEWHTAPLQKEVAGDDQSLMHMMQFQTINPDWTGRDDNNAREVEQAPSAPPAGSNQEKNGQKPLMRHKSLPGVLVEEPDQESSNEEEDGWLRLT